MNEVNSGNSNEYNSIDEYAKMEMLGGAYYELFKKIKEYEAECYRDSEYAEILDDEIRDFIEWRADECYGPVEISTKIRKHPDDTPAALVDLFHDQKDDTNVVHGSDDRGEYVEVSENCNFSISEIGVAGVEGEVLNQISIEDEFGNRYRTYIDDIIQIQPQEKFAIDIIKEVEAFYPEVAEQLWRLEACETTAELVEELRSMNISIDVKKLKDNVDEVALQLGRCATKLANLDSATHTVAFSGGFSVRSRYGDFSPRFTKDDVEMTVDIHSIAMEEQYEDKAVIFNPELEMKVGRPDAHDGYVELRIPLESIDRVESNRLKNLDFISGSDVAEVENPDSERMIVSQYILEEDDIAIDEAADSEKKVALAKEQLSASEDVLDRLIDYAKSTTRMDLSDERVLQEYGEVCEYVEQTSKRLGGDLDGMLLTYSGKGIIRADFENEEVIYGRELDAAVGLYGGLVKLGTEDEDSVQGEYYLALVSPTGSKFIGQNNQMDVEGEGVMPFGYMQSTIQEIKYVKVRDMESAPKIIGLDQIQIRERVAEKAEERFGRDPDVYGFIKSYIDVFNYSALADTEEDDTIFQPTDEEKHAALAPENIATCSDMMLESIGPYCSYEVNILQRSSEDGAAIEYMTGLDLVSVSVNETNDDIEFHVDMGDEGVQKIPLSTMVSLSVVANKSLA